MKKYISIICFLLLVSCETIEKDDSSQSNITIEKTIPQDKEKRNIVILPYNGKYVFGQSFFNLDKIVQLQKYTEELLAKRIGLLQQKELDIKITYKDWTNEGKDLFYTINQRIENNKITWEITYITEHLQNGFMKPSNIYLLSLAEVFLRSATKNHYQEIIFPIQKGILYYACDLGEWITQKTVLELVNDKRVLIENSIVGITSSEAIFPALEGYLSLIYLYEKYNYKNENLENDITKKFIFSVLFEKKEWQSQILATSGDDISTFVNNAKLFSIRYLKNRYYNHILKYNEALKNYLSEDYGRAIAQFQTFILQHPDTFFAGDMYFWMAMSYYDLKNYALCAEQLNNIFKHNAKDFCFHFFLARYRYAMAMYRLEKFTDAIEAFSIFERDFPWEKDFVGSSLYFQAEIFLTNKQYERALHQFEKFIRNHSEHHRITETTEKVAYLYLQEEKYRRAHELFTNLMEVPEKKTLAKQALEKIALLEQKGASPRLRATLDKVIVDYPAMNHFQKKETLKDMGFIGKISLFWLEKMYENSKEVFNDFINTIVYINEPSGITLLLKALADNTYDKEIFVALLKIGIPISELSTIVKNEISLLPEERQKIINSHLNDMYWQASEEMITKVPNFISDINGDAKQQLAVIENMTLFLGKEQIVVLKELVVRGKSINVKTRALESLVIWKEPTMIGFLEEMVRSELPELRYIAILGLSELGYANIKTYDLLLLDSDTKIRKAVLSILPRLEFSDTIATIIKLLNDDDYNIRNEAKEILSNAPYQKTNIELANAIVVEVDNIRYYNYIIQILLIRTKKTEILASYYPEMSLEQRKILRNQLIESWK